MKGEIQLGEGPEKKEKRANSKVLGLEVGIKKENMRNKRLEYVHIDNAFAAER